MIIIARGIVTFSNDQLIINYELLHIQEQQD